MNWNQIEGQWSQMKSNAKSAWGKLSNDDLMYIDGKRDKLIGKIQERYGVMKEQAQRDVDAWVEKMATEISRFGSSSKHR
jgi:uncharacterized protein YjbJ (UPF0337 family)